MKNSQGLMSVFGTVLSFPITFVLITILMAHDSSFVSYFFYIWSIYIFLIMGFYIWVLVQFFRLRDSRTKGFIIYFIVISSFILIDILVVLDGLVGL
jgi:hypothetical protein